MPSWTIWQGLGGFVAHADALSEDTLQRFSAVGGRWIVLLLDGDSTAAPDNLARLDSLRSQASQSPLNIKVGAWFNGLGWDPVVDAERWAGIVTDKAITGPVVLDLEGSYQGAGAAKMPLLVQALRKRLPHADIGVSTNGMNNSMIWNGRTLSPPQSFHALGIRCLPQWYSYLYLADGAYSPDAQMQWLAEHGATDYNFRDLLAVRGRGLPQSYAHGTLEVTGLEGGDLADELARVQQAKTWGYTFGLSLYLLENTPIEDWSRLVAVRGKLYRG